MKERRESIASPISSLWRMSPARSEVSTRSWPIASIRRGAVGTSSSLSAAGAGRLDLCGGKRGRREHARPHSVVDVVLDIRDPVDKPDDLAFERLGLVFAGVVEDFVADLCRRVWTPPAP